MQSGRIPNLEEESSRFGNIWSQLHPWRRIGRDVVGAVPGCWVDWISIDIEEIAAFILPAGIGELLELWRIVWEVGELSHGPFTGGAPGRQLGPPWAAGRRLLGDLLLLHGFSSVPELLFEQCSQRAGLITEDLSRIEQEKAHRETGLPGIVRETGVEILGEIHNYSSVRGWENGISHLKWSFVLRRQFLSIRELSIQCHHSRCLRGCQQFMDSIQDSQNPGVELEHVRCIT
jgi:hypothetical protein